jgi:pimeloyl-ACP methyl ester carboxylesterase
VEAGHRIGLTRQSTVKDQAVIDERISALPSKRLSVGGKTLAYRESGAGRPLVLLHGLGSGSAFWLFQLEGLAERYRVIAWDAPGYGESDPFSIERPHPADYARALSVLTSALQVKDFVLVAHSLGSLVAAAYARMFPSLAGMALISPAAGYSGNEEKAKERLKALDEPGPEGLAETRAPEMLYAPDIALELLRWDHRHIRRDGYRQATHCLVRGNLREDAPHYEGKVLVACGSADAVTPEAECRDIASRFPNAAYRSLPGLGHASPLEGPAQVNAAISDFASAATTRR